MKQAVVGEMSGQKKYWCDLVLQVCFSSSFFAVSK